MKTKIRNNRSKQFTKIACLGTMTLALVGVGCASKPSGQPTYTQSSPTAAAPSGPVYTQEYYSQDNNRFTGPAGPRGETGPAGQTGYTGATGATGGGIAGATGARGGSGPQGPTGPRGATGPSGDVVRGGAGVAGSVGEAGSRGATGRTGETGASVAGVTGATGATGSPGAMGPAGPVGPQGPTTVGPTGAAGERGYAGASGTTGDRGGRGATGAGYAGATGATGGSGDRGDAGDQGAMGSAGVISGWTNYRSIWFASNNDGLNAGDRDLVAQIAEYMKLNPSLRVGIDNTNPNGSGNQVQNLRTQRVNTVRNALLQAGVPSRQIESGAYGDPRRASENQVNLVLRTAQ